MATAAVAPQAPIELEGAYIPPQKVFIASIYPVEQRYKISRRAPQNEWIIPAGTKEKPGICPVEDTWESERTETFGNRNRRILATHTAEEIVNNLTVHTFEANAAEQAYPGVFICASENPTEEEIRPALEAQNRYWMLLVASAREKARLEKWKDIQPKERMAAKQLGLSGEKWMDEMSADATKKCVWCSKTIPGSAKKCPEAGCGGFQKPEYAAEFHAMNNPQPMAAPPAPAELETAPKVVAPVQPPVNNNQNLQTRTPNR